MGLVWAGLLVLVLVGRLGVGHDRLSAGGLVAGDDRAVGVGVQAGEPEVGEGAEPGVAQSAEHARSGKRREKA